MAIARSQISSLPEGFDDHAVAVLADLYKDAMRDLKEIGTRRLATDTRKLSSKAIRARQAMVEAESVLRRLDVDATNWISTYIPKSYRVGALKATKGLREIGVAGAFSFEPVFHEEAINVLMADMQDVMYSATENLRRGFQATLRRTQLEATMDKQITKMIAKAQITGATRKELSKGIAKELIEKYGDKPLLINGKYYNVQKYAELVARTKTRAAVTQGSINRYIEAEQDLVMITRHGSKCDICRYYEGRVFSISGTSDRYPALSQVEGGGPPFHPNCLHNVAPFVERLATRTERKRGADIDRRVLGKTMKEVRKLEA